jgi:hypothetical protein
MEPTGTSSNLKWLGSFFAATVTAAWPFAPRGIAKPTRSPDTVYVAGFKPSTENVPSSLVSAPYCKPVLSAGSLKITWTRGSRAPDLESTTSPDTAHV